MRYYHLKEQDYKISNWSGGKTKELAIFPANSVYLERNFLWRLSSATIETEESDFSKLPDYNRVLMVLKGEVILNYQGEKVTRLNELEQDSFDGQWKTSSYGKITDFNLMVRKGSQGYIDLLKPNNSRMDCSSTHYTNLTFVTHALYCRDGYAVINTRKDASPQDNEESHMIKPGELFVMEYLPEEKAAYSVMGEGTLIRSQIFYDDISGKFKPEAIPEEKPSFQDFKKCIFLANTQFRGAKFLCKSLKNTWYDEALQDAITAIEGRYITSIGFLIGFLAILMLSVYGKMDTPVVLLLILGWIILDSLIVSPLIYFMKVPKPVIKHIKNVDQLTPYEAGIREQQLGKNERVEKVLKKYKTSGKKINKE